MEKPPSRTSRTHPDESKEEDPNSSVEKGRNLEKEKTKEAEEGDREDRSTEWADCSVAKLVLCQARRVLCRPADTSGGGENQISIENDKKRGKRTE